MKEVRVENIMKVWCIKCGKHMYVNNGDTSDLTVEDVEGVECPHCGECFKLDPINNDNDAECIDYELASKQLA